MTSNHHKEEQKRPKHPRSVRMELLIGDDMKSCFGNKTWRAKRMLKLTEQEEFSGPKTKNASGPFHEERP